MFRLAYNTNGLAHHRVVDALRLVADLGYEGLAITPDVGQLDLYRLDPQEIDDVRAWSEELGIELAIETGARYLLDARRKHYPTLLEEDSGARRRREDFLKRSLDLAAALGAHVLSLWSGAAPDRERCEDGALDENRRRALLDRLARGLAPLLERARALEVQVALEPEPGMFLERPSGYGMLIEHMGASADTLGLCLDVGHLLVTRDLPVGKVIEGWANRLVHVHLDDIADGVHEHVMFGRGELDLGETLGALAAAGFDGLAAVELSRDSYRGAEAAREALERLHAALAGRARAEP